MSNIFIDTSVFQEMSGKLQKLKSNVKIFGSCLSYRRNIWDASRDLVPFVPFEKREKHPWRSLKVTLLHGCSSRFLNYKNGTKLRKTSHMSDYLFLATFHSWELAHIIFLSICNFFISNIRFNITLWDFRTRQRTYFAHEIIYRNKHYVKLMLLVFTC